MFRKTLVSSLLFLTFAGCSSFTTYCTPNGVCVVALRDIDDVFPIYASTLKLELDLAYKEKAAAERLTLGGAYESSVKQIYQDLDHINADVRNLLVSAYNKYVTGLSLAGDAAERATLGKAFDEAQAKAASFTEKIREVVQKLRSAQGNTSAGEWEAASRAARQAAGEATAWVKQATAGA